MTRNNSSCDLTESESELSNHSNYQSAENLAYCNNEDPKILEVYDQLLNLKEEEGKLTKSSLSCNNDSSISHGLYYLKQVCNNNELKLYPEVKSLYTKTPDFNKKTALIAQRIINTHCSLESTTKRRIPSKPILTRTSLILPNPSQHLEAIRQIPQKLRCLDKAPVRPFSSLHCCKRSSLNVPRISKPVQVSMNPETESISTEIDYQLHSGENRVAQTCTLSIGDSKKTQSRIRKTKTVETNYEPVQTNCKYTNTMSNSYKTEEQSTQMYEHITNSDLFCLEWINKNLFRAPMNPHTVIVDETIRESSEVTCKSSAEFERELEWEKEALCI